MTQAWWTALYDAHLADILLVRKDADELAATLGFLQRHLRLQHGQRVFDQCCGIGSLAIPLAAQGLCVSGCDLGQGYVARALGEGAALRARLDLHAADAFAFVPSAPCDAAFNWWTSFGYADTDEENIVMLRRAYESLKPGGTFALDFMNVPGVLRTFQPVVETSRETSQGLLRLTRLSTIDLVSMTMEKSWRYVLPSGERLTHPSRVRLYTPRELGALSTRVGFVRVRFLGSLEDAPLTLESPRCIVLGEVPQ